ncbi:hypothetical protein EBU71_08620 [bacterium]|nr:hypothetical protein [Candidatus Elulimicrobium humile]
MRISIKDLKKMIKEEVTAMSEADMVVGDGEASVDEPPGKEAMGLEDQISLMLKAGGVEMHPEAVKMILQYATPKQLELIKKMNDLHLDRLENLLDKIGGPQRDRARYPGARRGR